MKQQNRKQFTLFWFFFRSIALEHVAFACKECVLINMKREFRQDAQTARNFSVQTARKPPHVVTQKLVKNAKLITKTVWKTAQPVVEKCAPALYRKGIFEEFVWVAKNLYVKIV